MYPINRPGTWLLPTSYHLLDPYSYTCNIQLHTLFYPLQRIWKYTISFVLSVPWVFLLANLGLFPNLV